MVQERSAGNGNFDIDAISRAANAMADRANAALVETTQIPEIDHALEAIESEAADLTDEILSNPSSNRADEAMAFLATPAAAKLKAGVVSGIQAAITIQQEKATNGADAFRTSNETWQAQKDKREQERKAAEDADEFGDKMQNAAQQNEQQRQERAEAWANSDHEYAGQKMSAEDWLRMIAWFKSPENRKAWEDAMMAETGQSRDQVRATGDKIDELDALIEKESRGEILTAEEQARKTTLGNDAQVRQGIAKRTAMVDPSLAQSATINNNLGTERIDAGVDAFAVADREPTRMNAVDASPAKTETVATANQNTEQFSGTSVARELDGVAPQGERLNATFGRAASGESPATPVAPQMAVAQPKVAANFDASAGML